MVLKFDVADMLFAFKLRAPFNARVQRLFCSPRIKLQGLNIEVLCWVSSPPGKNLKHYRNVSKHNITTFNYLESRRSFRSGTKLMMINREIQKEAAVNLRLVSWNVRTLYEVGKVT